MIFRIDYWQIKLMFTLGQYKVLGDMINNEKATKEYFSDITKKSSKKIYQWEMNGVKI